MPNLNPKEYIKKNSKEELNPSEYIRKQLTPFGVDSEPIRAPKVVYEPEGRPIQAALYGAGEGITLDNLDEIIARGKSVFTPETYDKLIAEQEAYRRQLEEENPGVYNVSKFGSYAIPGLAATKLLKPATALGRLGIEGGLGAVQGMGEAESLEDVPASMLAGGAFSAGGSAALERAIPLAKKGVSKVGGKISDILGSVFTNTPPEVSQALRKDPKYLDDVMEIPEIADEAIRRLGQTKSRVGSLSESALATLRPEPLQNKASIIARLEELPEKYGITGTEDFPASQAILKEIELARNAILKSENEVDIRNILRRLGDRADFGTASGDSINAIRKEMRGILSEGIKEVNPQYREAMVPLAEQTDLSSRATKILRPEMKDGELVPTDRTSATLQTLMNDLGKDRKIRTRQQLEQLYPGLEEQLRKRQIMNRSQGGVQSGSRNAVTMGLGGGSIAEGINYSTGLTVPPGLIAGASIFAGAAIDKYGRTVGSAIAKAQGRAGRFLSKFGPMLEKSTNRELTHAILMETNPEYQQAFKEMQEGFNDPAQIANLVGSAVLGSDLTRGVASVGAGIGSAIEGGSFGEGMGERYRELSENPSQMEGVASLLGAALPTGRAGGIASRVIRGVQSLDELMSDTGRQKNAPNLMNIKMPSGDKFGSKVQDAEQAKKLLDGVKLPSGNKIKIEYSNDDRVGGIIEHPSIGKHTSFQFRKDRDGLWSLDHNFRNDKFRDEPLAKGSSTELRNIAAKVLGGIASDQFGRTSSIAQRSYRRDKEALPTKPHRDADYAPEALFFTPGDEKQKLDFEQAFEKSYGQKLDKEKLNPGKREERSEQDIERQLRRQTEKQEQRELEQIKDTKARITKAMNDPRYGDLHRDAEARANRYIERYIRDIEETGRPTLIPYFTTYRAPEIYQIAHITEPTRLIEAQYILDAYNNSRKRIEQAREAYSQRSSDQGRFLRRLRQDAQFEPMRQTARDIIEQGMQNRIRSIEAGDEVGRVRGDYGELGSRAYDMSLLSKLDKASPLERDQAKLDFLVESKKLENKEPIETRLNAARRNRARIEEEKRNRNIAKQITERYERIRNKNIEELARLDELYLAARSSQFIGSRRREELGTEKEVSKKLSSIKDRFDSLKQLIERIYKQENPDYTQIRELMNELVLESQRYQIRKEVLRRLKSMRKRNQ